MWQGCGGTVIEKAWESGHRGDWYISEFGPCLLRPYRLFIQSGSFCGPALSHLVVLLTLGGSYSPSFVPFVAMHRPPVDPHSPGLPVSVRLMRLVKVLAGEVPKARVGKGPERLLFEAENTCTAAGGGESWA